MSTRTALDWSAPFRDRASIRLPADLTRRTILPYLRVDRNQPYAVVAVDALALSRSALFAEIDTDFGVCLAVRLTGRYPAIGVIRQIPNGFREYWRSLGPAARPILRQLQAHVEACRPTPVFWRLEDGAFAELRLRGWNRQHRLWYARLDRDDSTSVQFQLVDDADDSATDPSSESALA
ncbi:MAG: hypothetical protein NZ518_03235 [Dehalococcoidia bacterium]|nr:hypothetical protein [Dehalococcoidia bacterium]